MLRVLAVLSAMAWPWSGAAQNCAVDLPGAQKIESDSYVLAYRAQPANIAVSRHFSLDIMVCPKGGPAPPESVRVDARMPEHGHGMNYTPAVKALGKGNFRADGLMFHMPGRWEFVFEVRGGGKVERLRRSYTLE